MPEAAFSIQSEPSPRDLAALEERIYEFNVEATGYDDGELLAILLHDDAGALVAGLSGHTWGGCCEIKNLWIERSRRSAGLGSRLLAAAEAEAVRRGCFQILLSTHSFQAPDFHRRHGYHTLAVIEDHPRGHAQIWLRKQLARRNG